MSQGGVRWGCEQIPPHLWKLSLTLLARRAKRSPIPTGPHLASALCELPKRITPTGPVLYQLETMNDFAFDALEPPP